MRNMANNWTLLTELSGTQGFTIPDDVYNKSKEFLILTKFGSISAESSPILQIHALKGVDGIYSGSNYYDTANFASIVYKLSGKNLSLVTSWCIGKVSNSAQSNASIRTMIYYR